MLAQERVARVMIDEATLCAEAEPASAASSLAEAARKVDAETSLLWTQSREGGAMLAAGMTRLIAKPIAGSALVAALFADGCDEAPASPLVSQAA